MTLSNIVRVRYTLYTV